MAITWSRALTVVVLLCHVTFGQSIERMTSHGRVRGNLHEVLPGQHVERYFGIPYAAPPVGELRFEPPQPPAAWSGVRNATELPPACWQTCRDFFTELSVLDFRGPYQEDCLYLNVHVPSTEGADQLLPVLVHLHGGSNECGLGAMFNGDVLAARGRLIVVTLNYRLGLLGFLGLGEEGFRGNFGLLDQVAALQWVKDNIRHFGGDPSHVTLQGHSAGGADVGLHVVSPLSRGLFRYAVLQSGFPLTFYGVEQAPYSTRKRTLKLAKEKGCLSQGERSVKNCLKRLPLSELAHVPPTDGYLVIYLPAIVDGHFLTAPVDLSLERGELNGEAFMLGVTGDDGLFYHESTPPWSGQRLELLVDLLLPPTDVVRQVAGVRSLVLFEYTPRGPGRGPDNHTALDLARGYILGDSSFRAPALRMADLLTSHGHPTYFYSFDYDSPLTSRVGVPHGTDLFYLTGIPFTGHPRFNYSEEDRDVSSELMTLWTNFVTHGSPRTRQGTLLSPYTSATLAYFKVSAGNGSATVRQDHALRAHQVAMWNELLPRLAVDGPNESHVVTTALVATSAVLAVLVVAMCAVSCVCLRHHRKLEEKESQKCEQDECAV